MHSNIDSDATPVALFHRVPSRATAALTRALAALLVVLVLIGGSAGGTLAAPEAAGEANAFTQDIGDPGQAIADFALQFAGYPYVWAGNTPAGFDCSGFTQYVVLNTVGIDIGHGTAGQTAYGAFVEWDAWQRGDLVYFANTYGAGISHAGIYIGDGQFIHAENEATGVTISSLYSDYYSAHYYGAYRVA